MDNFGPSLLVHLKIILDFILNLKKRIFFTVSHCVQDTKTSESVWAYTLVSYVKNVKK